MVARNTQEPAKPDQDATEADAGLSAQPQPALDVPAEQSLDAMRERIKELETELAKSNAAKDLAEEESARLSAQAQSSFLTTGVVEKFAGKTEDGKDLWWYRVDLAPGGGTHIMINNRPYLHGETYKFDTDTLRSVKEIVGRTWTHENDIHGHAFNAYRKQQQKVLGAGPVPGWARQ
jgi:hypothetical protein